MTWVDRFVKLAGRDWIVLEQCAAGMQIACDGTLIFVLWSAIGGFEYIYPLPRWNDCARYGDN